MIESFGDLKPDWTFFFNEISSYCGKFGTKLLQHRKSRLWNCKLRKKFGLDYGTRNYGILDFLALREMEYRCCLFATAH